MKIQQSTISYSPIEKINVTRVASGSNCAKILFTTKLSTTLQDLFYLSFGYTAGRKFKKKVQAKKLVKLNKSKIIFHYIGFLAAFPQLKNLFLAIFEITKNFFREIDLRIEGFFGIY